MGHGHDQTSEDNQATVLCGDPHARVPLTSTSGHLGPAHRCPRLSLGDQIVSIPGLWGGRGKSSERVSESRRSRTANCTTAPCPGLGCHTCGRQCQKDGSEAGDGGRGPFTVLQSTLVPPGSPLFPWKKYGSCHGLPGSSGRAWLHSQGQNELTSSVQICLFPSGAQFPAGLS